MSRLLQQLRGFSHLQSVRRLQLLGFIPDEYVVSGEFYLPRQASRPARPGTRGSICRTDAGEVRQIDVLFTRAALYERFRAAAGL